MWTFFIFALALVVTVVASILQAYAAKDVPWHARLTTFYCWLCAAIIIVLMPLDIWATLEKKRSPIIPILWQTLYWSTQALTWLVCPIHATYMDAGNFTVGGRLLTSLKENGLFYAALGGVGVVGLLSILFFGNLTIESLQGFGIALSNGQGLFIGIFLLGYGLVEIPRGIWRRANVAARVRYCAHRLGKVEESADAATKELAKVVMIVQSTSAAMPRQGDALRIYMDRIEAMVGEEGVAAADSSLLGDDDLDYDHDVAGLAALRRRLAAALIGYRRGKAQYKAGVLEALEMEDRLNNMKAGGSTYASSLRPPWTTRLARWPAGKSLGDLLDEWERRWKCVLEPVAARLAAAFLALVSLAIVIAEVGIVTGGKPDISVFSLLLGKADDAQLGEFMMQILAGWPLIYICFSAYSSLFRLGTLSFFFLMPGCSDAPSLIFSGSLLCRFAAPLSYNYIFLMPVVHRYGDHTNLAHVMGPMDHIPFFGGELNKYFPTVIVAYCAAIIFNIPNRLIGCCFKGHRFQFDAESEDDAYAQRGKALIKQEREHQEADQPVGEYVPKAAPAPTSIRALFGGRKEPAPVAAATPKEKSGYAKLKESGYRPGAYTAARDAKAAASSSSGAKSSSLLGGLGLGKSGGSSAGGGGGSGGGGASGGGALSGLDNIFSSLKSKGSDVEDEEMASTELLPRRKW